MTAVSVLIPTFNRARFLPESLESVLGQTVPPTQVIVINDGSTDNTREALEPYMGKIEYLEKKNGGKSTALNLALPRVRGDYVWIMDDDDMALPDALETHLRVLGNDPSLGFTWSARYLAKTKPEGKGLEILKLDPVHQIQDGELFLDLLEQNVIACHSVMVRRASCFAEVGPFNPELIRSQDYDMALRIARRFKGQGIDKPTILYRMHSEERGSATTRFSADEINLKWREYDRKIFRRVRQELELAEYLPAQLRREPLGALEQRRAYLKRMNVMASKGMIHEMVEDLQQVLGSSAADAPLSSAEQALVLRSMGYLWPEDFSALRRELAADWWPGANRAVELRIEMARGLWWRIEPNVRKGHLKQVLDIVRLTHKILGWRGFRGALQAKHSGQVRDDMWRSEHPSQAAFGHEVASEGISSSKAIEDDPRPCEPKI